MTSFPCLDVLPLAQRQIWPELAAARTEGFVLYGGTAIALHLGHRESVDFDFFSDKSFEPDNLVARLPVLVGADILQTQPDTLTVLARPADSDATVKLSFFGGLGFGRLKAPVETPDGVLAVASMDDLLAHKLKVLLQRVELKDYQDIDALLGHGLDLAHGCGGAQALFSTFAPQECLKALTYFKDPALGGLGEHVKRTLVDAAARVMSIPKLVIASKTLSVRR